MGQGQGPILPLQSSNGREWPLNCMTVISACWRLNIRFKDPVGDRVGVELLFNSVEFGVQKQLPVELQTVETRCGREGHTRPRGSSESPDGVDPNIRRTRHNVTVITVGSKYEVYVRLQHLSHANLTNKLRGKCNSKEVFLCLPSCILIIPASSFLHAS